jgi:hypothetical protein
MFLHSFSSDDDDDDGLARAQRRRGGGGGGVKEELTFFSRVFLRFFLHKERRFLK